MGDSDESVYNNRDEKDTEQTTLLETDSEFWQTMRALIRAELSHFITTGKKGPLSKKPKPKGFWNKTDAKIKSLITRFGYVNYQMCKEHDSWFSQKEFDHPIQVVRRFNRLVRTGEYVPFRITPGARAPWYLTRKEDAESAKKKAIKDAQNKLLKKVNRGGVREE